MKIRIGDTNKIPRTCLMCGVEFIGFPRSRYCAVCTPIRRKQQREEHEERKRAGKTIVLGQTVGVCEVCGDKFIYGSAVQKYCSKCSEMGRKASLAEQKKGWLQRACDKYGEQYREDLYKNKNANRRISEREKRRQKQKFCKGCQTPIPTMNTYCPDCAKLHRRYTMYVANQKRNRPDKIPMSFEEWKEKRSE